MWFVVVAAGLLVAGALVVDVGAKVRTTTQVDIIANETARCATGAIDPRTRASNTDVEKAVRAAQTCLARSGATGAVTVTGPGEITVTASKSGSGPWTGRTWTISRAATARLNIGVETGQ
ncbi:hypothetical protein M3697_12490 [Janibacter melonis]|uniref:hypothetical protein n=1 Tax=Janibacter melonis TaxID=262209 RepID=UPI0020439CFC|nr:hypothetical protein [Janibacter melonis]MCM3555915.1 hypothetical protein [Janibacter melonis]